MGKLGGYGSGGCSCCSSSNSKQEVDEGEEGGSEEEHHSIKYVICRLQIQFPSFLQVRLALGYRYDCRADVDWSCVVCSVWGPTKPTSTATLPLTICSSRSTPHVQQREQQEQHRPLSILVLPLSKTETTRPSLFLYNFSCLSKKRAHAILDL